MMHIDIITVHPGLLEGPSLTPLLKEPEKKILLR